MNEAEWLACDDPLPMMEFLSGKASERKLRLFACACCRRIWHLLKDPRSRRAAEVSEQYADGIASEAELREAGIAADAAADDTHGEGAEAADAAADVVNDFRSAAIAATVADYSCRDIEKAAQCALLRDLFGHPFQQVMTDPSCLAWNDGTIRKMAQSIYDARAFDRLPLLADALEDAGCAAADILSHCRTPGEHVRGCWVVDLLLGKS
jgi:hypothetical protein